MTQAQTTVSRANVVSRFKIGLDKAKQADLELNFEQGYTTVLDVRDRLSMYSRLIKKAPFLSFVFVIFFCLGLRLVYLVAYSKVPIIWDAQIYWQEIETSRDFICQNLSICTASSLEPIASQDIFTGIYGRTGLMPIFIGTILSILGLSAGITLVLFILFDLAVCVMVMDSVKRLGGKWFFSVLAGLIYATNIPLIVGTAAILQQPFIRFFLMLSIWAYIVVITASSKRDQRVFVVISTVAVLLTGFSSISTRPLIWLIPCGAILLAWLSPRQANISRMYVKLTGLIVVVFLLIALVLNLSYNSPFADTLSKLSLGIGGDGTAMGQSTVLSFPNFWGPSEHWLRPVNQTESLFSDISQSPMRFGQLLLFSIYSNWYFPDYVYFQSFILSFDQQILQHYLLLFFGISGLLYLSGQGGNRQKFALMVGLIAACLSVIYGIISVEPRRLSVLTPYLCIAAGFALEFVYDTLRQRVKWELKLIFFLVFLIAIWLMPVDYLHYLIVDASIAYVVLVGLRLSFLWLACLWLIRYWRKQSSFEFLYPLIGISGVILLMAAGSLQSADWRLWTAPIQSVVRTEIQGLELQPYLQPWLLIDIDYASQASQIEIELNGLIIKEIGTELRSWEAPQTWHPVQSVSNFAQPLPERALWLALPLEASQISATESLVITLRSESSVAVRGDFIGQSNKGDAIFIPLFSPWYDANSFWRWGWNASDPRIPGIEILNGDYRSSYYNNGTWHVNDLSSDSGLQTGLYRIYIVEAAFGGTTNALSGIETAVVELSDSCQGHPSLRLQACQQADNSIAYHLENQRLGTSPISVFQEDFQLNRLVDQLTIEGGHIDIIQVMSSHYVANYYQNGHLIESLVFIVD